MIIPVLGMDPSFRNWGLASANLDMSSGTLSSPVIRTIRTKPDKSKQVRKNSSDLADATELAREVYLACQAAKIVFVEVPEGSQSARSAATYGACIGILGSLSAHGVQLIEVNPSENKKVFTGVKDASKKQMIDKAVELYPNAAWPRFKGEVASSAEHMADAVAAIHAGVLTPAFQQLLTLYRKT